MLTSTTQHYLDKALATFDAKRSAYLQNVSEHATALHKDQARRPSGESYDNHVVRVASRIINDFGVIDEDLFIIGLLHDAVEDQLEKLTGTSQASRDDAYTLLEHHYSKRVSDAIKGLSNTEEYERTENRTKRNKLYVDHVLHECTTNTDCFIVKLSDFFDNAMQLQHNTTNESRVKGAVKYLPLFDYFSQTLRSTRHLPLSASLRNELASRIEAQKEYAQHIASPLAQGKPSLQQLTAALHKAWDEKTGYCEAGVWSADNPARGQCVTSSLVVQDYFGGEIVRYEVHGKDIDETHYFNILEDGTILDTTGQQYTVPVTMRPKPVEFQGYLTLREKRLADNETSDRYYLLKARVESLLNDIL